MHKSKIFWTLGLLAMLAAVCTIYGLGLHNSLVFDDGRLSDGTIFGRYGSLLEPKVRMLSYGSFVWIQSLAGDSIALQRAFNILLHIANCYAIWLLVTELFKHTEFSEEARAEPGFDTNIRISIFAAVSLFAVHPVGVYAVGYLVQRSMLMMTLFSALACWAYIRALSGAGLQWAALAVVFLLCALMSKEHAVVLPALALPLYVFVKRPTWKRLLTIAAAIVLLIGVFTALLWTQLGAFVGAVATDDTSWAYVRQLEQLHPGISSSIYPLSLLNQGKLFFEYGLLWFLPNVQWMALDLRPVFPLGFGSLPHLLGGLGYLALVIGSAVLLLRRRDAWGLVGLVLLCTALLFSTEFVTSWLQDPFVLYRSYIWAMLLPALLALVLLLFPRKLMVAIACAAGLVLTGLAAERSLSLKTPYTAWSDAAQKVDAQAPFNAFGRWRPFINRGAYLLENLSYEQALQDFETAIALQEPQGSAQFNRGMALELLKRYPEALAAFDSAQKQGFDNAALAYHQATAYKLMQQMEPAFQSYAKALKLQPEEALVSKILLEQAEVAIPAGHYDVAIANYQRLLKKAPDNTRLEVGLGIALIGKQDFAQALQIFDASLARRPNPPAYYGKALVYRAKGDRAQAIHNLQRASAMDPANPVYRQLLQQLQRGQ
ncbi:tetratricopeptide repeat protein [Comamonas piscis]|uniref:Tetratricopeptide repeat protein n=1 Tax=Comamonas piscis TaxID=1562974 RepID=A0A7G5ED56_9BURK|nr:tetratricopeptide repeat protein [Comamonas piscis]QMV71931.1 tetratricopeptide repeat protein [Comamonas piscis]WSO34672.1 tetratricopeptide repeat protein [Comamonas piscis]